MSGVSIFTGFLSSIITLTTHHVTTQSSDHATKQSSDHATTQSVYWQYYHHANNTINLNTTMTILDLSGVAQFSSLLNFLAHSSCLCTKKCAAKVSLLWLRWLFVWQWRHICLANMCLTKLQETCNIWEWFALDRLDRHTQGWQIRNAVWVHRV